jgi:predicted RNase H-like HicB family nuclease
MQFEVELSEEEGGVFKAIAVVYPTVTASGRTEKEALGLLMEAMEKYMRARAKDAARA